MSRVEVYIGAKAVERVARRLPREDPEATIVEVYRWRGAGDWRLHRRANGRDELVAEGREAVIRALPAVVDEATGGDEYAALAVRRWLQHGARAEMAVVLRPPRNQ